MEKYGTNYQGARKGDILSVETTVQSIQEKTIEIFTKLNQMTGFKYFSRRNDKFREWRILCTTCDLLKKSGEPPPTVAREFEGPDFFIGYSDSSEFGCEVTEILEPGYRRDDYWKRVEAAGGSLTEEISAFIEEPWMPLRATLEKKATKPYARSSWLIVVFNIGRFRMRDFELPFHEQVFSEHERSPFSAVSFFNRVLILSSDLDSMVELFPEERTIVPDRRAISGESTYDA